MKQMKSKGIFTEEELYKFCLGEVCGIAVEVESGYNSDWADFADEDLESIYNKLSNAEQVAFDKQLKKAALKFKHNFDNLSQNIESEEDYMELQEEKNRLMYEIANQLSDFLIA